MYDTYSERVRKVLLLANREALRNSYKNVETEHILLGLIREGTGLAIVLLSELEIHPIELTFEIEKFIQSGENKDSIVSLPFASRSQRALKFAERHCEKLHKPKVNTGHLLLGLIEECEGLASYVITHFWRSDSDITLRALKILENIENTENTEN